MKKLSLLLLLAIFTFCSQKNTEVKIIDLSDYESGQVIIHKPSDNNLLKINKVVGKDGNYFYVNESINQYELYDFESGQRFFSYQIPKEGPEFMKGGMNGSSVLSSNTYAVFNQSGYFHLYENGKLHHSQKIPISEISNDKFIQISKESGNIIKTDKDTFQIIFNPFELMNPQGGFDIEFRSWVMELNEESGLQCISDFKSPFDESYSDSPSATLSIGAQNNKNQEYWFMFALSDSIYQIENCKIIQKKKLDTSSPFLYFPDLVKRNGMSAQWNPNPKSHQNLKLFYDIKTERYIRIVKKPQNISEQELQKMDIRTSSKLKKEYQILIYNNKWTLEAISNFVIPEENTIESCFVHDGFLYLNQPNQRSEDEYILIKYDLSKAIS